MSNNPLDGISLHGAPLEEKLKHEKDQVISRQFESEVIEKKSLMAPIHTLEEFEDPNCPKVVVDKNNFAVYFSREPIPSTKNSKSQSKSTQGSRKTRSQSKRKRRSAKR